MFARLLVWAIAPSASQAFLWNATDLAGFGLVLNITNISLLEHQPETAEWKTISNGVSLLLIVLFGVVFTMAFMSELNPSLIEQSRLKQIAGVLCIGSFILGHSVVDRINRSRKLGVTDG